MAVNKVEINGVVKLDLTADTVTAAKLAHGETAHDASGKLITGTMIVPQLQIVVKTNAGATVAATKGDKTVSGTADVSGNCTLSVDEAGTWTVTATAGSSHKSTEVVVGTSSVGLTLISSVFSENDWSTIIEACQSGEVPSTWAVGDQKIMTIDGHDYLVDILGKNHDTYADGPGTAPLTFVLHDCYGTLYKMNTSNSDTGKIWTNTYIRKTVLPALLKLMPEEVQRAVREVSKTIVSSVSTPASYSIVTDKLFILSLAEVFAGDGHSQTDGTPYTTYFGQDSTLVASSKRVKKYLGTAMQWWLRTPSAYAKECYTVNAKGQLGVVSLTTECGLVFAFCF